MKWQQVTPPSISTWSKYSVVSDYAHQGGSRLTMAPRTWTANVAIYAPFWLPWPYTVKRMWWQNGSSAGNHADVGIYTWEGCRIVSCGPTLMSGNSAPQYVACDVLLSPGWYYMAFMHNSGTINRCYGNNGVNIIRGRQVGLRQETTSGFLPSTATLGVYSFGQLEHHGITRLTTGF